MTHTPPSRLLAVLFALGALVALAACGDPGYAEDDDGDTGETAAPLTVLLIEDPEGFSASENPGADIDAIALTKADGRVFYATSVVDAATFIPAEGSQSWAPERAVGAPDAVEPGTQRCYGGGPLVLETFVSLNGGALAVRFEDSSGEAVPIEPGDTLRVFELDPTECGRFDEDAFIVSLAARPEGPFEQLGELVEGPNTVTVGAMREAP